MLSTLDWVIIGIYLVFALLVGVVLARRAGSSMKEFFVSGRNLPWWLAGTSMVATSFSCDTPLFITGLVRKNGISENWMWWSLALGGMLSVFLLARLWRRAEVVTDVELTELRYSGKPAAALRGFKAAYWALPVNCLAMGLVILGMLKVFNVIFGFQPVVALAVLLLITTVYCVLSGFWGVVVTDLVQFVVAMGGSIVMAVLAVRSMGGLDALVVRSQEASPLGERLLQFFPRFPEGVGPLEWAFWQGPFFAFLIYIAVQSWLNKNSDGGGAIIQRMSSTRNERHALLATLWFNVANYALRPWPWILVALASVVLLPEMTDNEAAYAAMIPKLAPAGLLGLIVASFLAAFMSTVDTMLNLCSSYVVNDLYRRFLRRDASERHYVWAGRILSVVFMLLGSLVALQYDSIVGLFQFMMTFTAGAGLVYLGRWFWWRINAWSEISAMAASAVIATALAQFTSLVFPFTLVPTIFGSTVVWVTVTFLTAPVSMERLVAFYRKVRPYGAWGPVAAAAGVAPARGLGRMVVNWIAGTAMVLAATMAVGKFLLGFYAAGWVYTAVAVAGAVVISREVLGLDDRQASVAKPRTAPPEVAAEGSDLPT